MNDLTAPEAPGRLGEAVDPQRMFNYLDQLGAWINARRTQLDELDQAAQLSQHAAELTADMALSMSLWQTIKTRYGNLLQVWDSGRVGQKEAEQLSALVWGRLEAPGGTGEAGQVPGMSLPEACKLSDALTNQLRVRLQIDPSGSLAIARLSTLRENLERLRDQVALEPLESAGQARSYLAQLTSRVQDASDKAGRGGDVGGLLGPLEIETATFERDLIVGGAVRRQNREQHEAVSRRRDALAGRGRRLNDFVAQVVAAVAEPPKYAVPNVAALGPIPVDKADLDAFETKLARVDKAMDFVEKAYTDALQLAAQPAPAPEPEQPASPAAPQPPVESEVQPAVEPIPEPELAPEAMPELEHEIESLPEPAEVEPDLQPEAVPVTDQQTPLESPPAPFELAPVADEPVGLDPLRVTLDDLQRQPVGDDLLAGLISTAAHLVALKPQPTRAAEAALLTARAYRDWLAGHPDEQAAT